MDVALYQTAGKLWLASLAGGSELTLVQIVREGLLQTDALLFQRATQDHDQHDKDYHDDAQSSSPMHSMPQDIAHETRTQDDAEQLYAHQGYTVVRGGSPQSLDILTVVLLHHERTQERSDSQ